jgi:hypothetical protein
VGEHRDKSYSRHEQQREPIMQREAIIIYHNDWAGAKSDLETELQSRDYTVTITDEAEAGLSAISNASDTLVAGDFLVVFLAGHGGNTRNDRNDTSVATAAGHYVVFNSGTLAVDKTAPLFEAIANKGIKLTVIDGSCSGGESVLYGMGQDYCIVSTTGVYSPSAAGIPFPSHSMSKDGDPGAFGFWWSQHLTASWMNGDIISMNPERIQQRLFRNDQTDIANLSLFLRPSIRTLTFLDLGGWNLNHEYCYLYRFIYPEGFAALSAAQQDKFTNDLASFLAKMHSLRDPAQQFFTRLRDHLDNASLLNAAAKVYATHHEEVWKTLANNPNWDIASQPGKYAAAMIGLTPDSYEDETGFLEMAEEIGFLLDVLETGFAQQEALLHQIDAAAKDLYEANGIDKLIKNFPVENPWPPEPGEPLNEFNEFERRLRDRLSAIDTKLNIDHRFVVEPLRRDRSAERGLGTAVRRRLGTAARRLRRRTLTVERFEPTTPIHEGKALDVINQAITMYEMEFTKSIPKKVIGSAGVSKAMLLGAYKKWVLENLVGEFKSVSSALIHAESRLSYLLSIVEDAINKVQCDGNSPCDENLY